MPPGLEPCSLGKGSQQEPKDLRKDVLECWPWSSRLVGEEHCLASLFHSDISAWLQNVPGIVASQEQHQTGKKTTDTCRKNVVHIEAKKYPPPRAWGWQRRQRKLVVWHHISDNSRERTWRLRFQDFAGKDYIWKFLHFILLLHRHLDWPSLSYRPRKKSLYICWYTFQLQALLIILKCGVTCTLLKEYLHVFKTSMVLF